MFLRSWGAGGGPCLRSANELGETATPVGPAPPHWAALVKVGWHEAGTAVSHRRRRREALCQVHRTHECKCSAAYRPLTSCSGRSLCLHVRCPIFFFLLHRPLSYIHAPFSVHVRCSNKPTQTTYSLGETSRRSNSGSSSSVKAKF